MYKQLLYSPLSFHIHALVPVVVRAALLQWSLVVRLRGVLEAEVVGERCPFAHQRHPVAVGRRGKSLLVLLEGAEKVVTRPADLAVVPGVAKSPPQRMGPLPPHNVAVEAEPGVMDLGGGRSGAPRAAGRPVAISAECITAACRRSMRLPALVLAALPNS